MVWLAIIGSASIQIRADDKYFEPDVQRAVKRIKNVAIQLKADVDLTKATKKIRDLRYRITSKDAVLKIDANLAKAEAKMAKFLAKFLEKDLNFNAVANTQGANTALSTLANRYKNTRIPFTAQADTAGANSMLAFAARNRRSMISATVDPRTTAALTGLFNTLTGTLPMDKIRTILSGVAANFESIAIGATKAAVAVGAVSAALLTTGANVLSIAGDISQLIGLTALLPTAIGSMAAIITTNKMAWKGFGEAMSSDAKKAAEALAKLPPAAQKAAVALRGTYTEIQKPVQNAFWEVMGTALQDTVKVLIPDLKTGLSGVGRSMAELTRESLFAFGRLSDGSLLNMLNNLATGLGNLAPGMGPFLDALNTLGEVGSTYLPMFGTYLAEAATKFGNFIAEAEKAGKINVWIETGVQRLQELGSMAKSTAGIFGGLADAARISGAPGMTEMAEGLRNVRDIVNGEPFQSRLVEVFEGARAGTDAFAEGLGNLTEYIGESSGSISLFLDKTGQVAGTTLDSFRALFDGTNLGTGIYKAVEGLRVALLEMAPGFSDLGDTIGDLGEIADVLFRSMAPGLNQLFETVKGVVAGLKDGIIAAMPVFNEFVQAILELVQGPIVAIAEQVGDVLQTFADLPAVVQTVIMSIGLFLLLKNKFIGFFAGIGQSLTNEQTNMGRAFNQIRAGANQMRGGVADSFATMGASIKNALVETVDSSGKAFSPLIGRAQDTADRVKGAFSEASAGIKNGLNLSPQFDTVRDGFQRVATNFSQTASGMGDTLRGVGTTMVQAIAPTGGALDTMVNKVRTVSSNLHADFAPARAAFTALGPAALEAGRIAGTNLSTGLKNAAGGLMGALGGAWGLALAGATIALGIFAAEQAKTAAQVDSLAASLEAQAGAFSDGSRKIVAKDLLDLDATAMDDFFRLISNQGRNAEEIIDALGVSSKTVVATLSDRTARTKYMEDWKKIGENAYGTRADFDKLAGSVGTTGKALEDLKPQEITEMAKRVKEAGDLAVEAEKKYEAMAKATGTSTIQAAALAANYDILNSATSSVSSKFGAFKSNLDILNGGLETTRNATRDNAEEMLNFGDKVVALAEKNGGLVEGTKLLSQSFKDSLLNIDGTFSHASKGAIDFSRQMESSRDTILQVGVAEMQKLRDAGMELPEAQAGALKAMEGPLAAFRQKLTDLGIDGTMVNQIMGQLGLDPEKLRGALVVDTGDAEAKIARASLMAAAFASGNYEVAFTALTDDAKNEILKVTDYAEAYKNGGWKAVMEIIDKTGDKVPEFLLGMKEAKNLEDIKKVIDIENPGAKKIAEASSALDNYGMKIIPPKGLEAIDGVTPTVETAKGALAGYGVVAIGKPKLEATDATGTSVESARTNMGSLLDVTRNLFSSDKTEDGRTTAQNTMWGLVDVTRNLWANNAAGAGVGLANVTMGLFNDKSVDLKANDKASGTIGEVDRKGISDKSFNIIGVLSGVSAAVRIALGMANGGIMKGGVQKFANGGILSKVNTPQIKAYAGGGIENHVAQIARGAWPVRVWAEPETGGEAYLPLAKSKRKRSLEILRQVMDEFGLGHLAKFADGGIMKNVAVSPRSGSSFSGFDNGGSSVITTTTQRPASPTIITNVYPSAGLSEDQVADSVSENIYWKLSTQI